jgi:hypothetical protein
MRNTPPKSTIPIFHSSIIPCARQNPRAPSKPYFIQFQLLVRLLRFVSSEDDDDRIPDGPPPDIVLEPISIFDFHLPLAHLFSEMPV